MLNAWLTSPRVWRRVRAAPCPDGLTCALGQVIAASRAASLQQWRGCRSSWLTGSRSHSTHIFQSIHSSALTCGQASANRSVSSALSPGVQPSSYLLVNTATRVEEPAAPQRVMDQMGFFTAPQHHASSLHSSGCGTSARSRFRGSDYRNLPSPTIVHGAWLHRPSAPISACACRVSPHQADTVGRLANTTWFRCAWIWAAPGMPSKHVAGQPGRSQL
jgi:hypothetical protein